MTMAFTSDTRDTGDKVGVAHRFDLEIGGIKVASFAECSGFGLTVATDKLEEGGVNHTTRKLPGRTDFTNIVLKHGVTSSTELFDWVMETVNGRVKRQTVTLHVLNPGQKPEEMTFYEVMRAFPVKWTAPTFQTSSNSGAIETLELAHDGFEKI
jgi:phage tail-like protein